MAKERHCATYFFDEPQASVDIVMISTPESSHVTIHTFRAEIDRNKPEGMKMFDTFPSYYDIHNWVINYMGKK